MFNLRFFSSLLFCLFVHQLTFAQPSNDDCSDPINIAPNDKCITSNGTFNGSTKSILTQANSFYDVWYSFVATSSKHYITVSGSGTYRSGIELYSGTCGSLTSLSQQKNTSTSMRTIFNGLTIGNTYYYRVFNNSSNSLPSVNEFSTCVQNFIKNDECTGAQDITVGYDLSISLYSNFGATNSLAPCSGTSATSDVWFKFKAINPIQYIFLDPISTTSTFNGVFQVFSGTCGSLNSIKCINENSNGKGENTALTGLTVGQDYYLRVYDANTSPTDYNFFLSIISPPENNDCSGAVLLDSKSYTCNGEIGDGTFATQSFASTSGIGNADDDVWYKFIADTSTYYISVNASTNYDPVVEVFEDDCITKYPAPNSFNNDVAFPANGYGTAPVKGLTKGKTYYYRVYDKDEISSNTLTFSTCVSKPPINDDCSGAINVNSSSTCKSINGEGSYASQSLAAKVSGTNANDDVWYSFKATSSTHFINVNPSFQYNPVVELFSNCSTYASQSLKATTSGSPISLKVTGLTPTQTYYYRVFDTGSISSQSMTFSTCVTNSPSNDECSGAKLLTVSSTCDEVKSDGTYATKSLNPCTGTGNAADDDTWFKFIPTTGSVFISVKPDDSKYNPVVQVFSDCATPIVKSCFSTSFPAGKFGDTIVSGLNPNQYYFYRVYDKNTSNQDTMTFSTCVTTATTNDDCINAKEVTSSSTCNPVIGDGTYASQSLNPCSGITGAANDDTWYFFTATKKDEFITVTPDDSNYDPVVEVFDGGCGTSMSPPICEDNKFPVGTFGRVALQNLQIGKKYFYRVYDKNTTNQDVMTFTTCVIESVSNDDCTNALDLTSNSSCVSTPGDGTYATQSFASTCGGTADDDVWYKFTATGSKEYISIISSVNYDPIVQVYKDCSTQLSPTICNDANYPKNGYGNINLTTVAGTTYYFRVYDKSNSNPKLLPFEVCVSHKPDNDDCTGAIQITPALTCNEVSSESTFATQSLLGSCSGTADDDIWFKFKATDATHNLNINASTNFDPIVEIYSSCSATPTKFLISGSSCNDTKFPTGGTGTWLLTGLTVGNDYWYRVFDKSSGNSNQLTFSTCITPQPTTPINDNPCKAIYKSPTSTASYTNYTNEAGTKTNQFLPTSCTSQPGSDVWFSTKVPFSGQLTFKTKAGSMSDGMMAIYKGTCKTMFEIDCEDDVSGSKMPTSALTGLNPGDSIFIRIWDKNSTNAGLFGLSITKGPEASLVGPCTNLDFENGFNGWFGTYGAGSGGASNTVGSVYGAADASSPNYVPTILNTTSQPNQFTLVGPGFDPYGNFSNIFQGSKSLKLGYESTSNQGRSIEQYFQVTPSNNLFIYNYAVVLDNGYPHNSNIQPHFRAEFFDNNGTQISCGDYIVAGATKGNTKKIGFSTSLKKDAAGLEVSYKPWTTVGVDLTPYIGQNVHVRFTTTSCGDNTHFGYVYLDCSCAPFEIEKPAKVCVSDTAHLYAPKGALSYEWKDPNGNIVGTKDSLVFKTTTPGKFKYTLKVIMFGTSSCTSNLETELEVGNKPTLLIKDPDAVCSPNTVDITKPVITTGSTLGLVYNYFSDANAANAITNQTSIDVSGKYYIKGEKSPTCFDIQPVVVKINPTPKIADTTAIICSGDSLKLLPLLSLKNVIPADTKYKWTIETNSSNITGQSTEAIGKSDIKNKLSNKVNTAQKIKYKITPFTPTCEGTPFYYEITVNPKPQIKDSTSSICTDVEFNINPKNLSTNVVPAGTTYTWIFKENTNVTNESNSATDESTIKSYTQKLINTTNTIQPVEHRVSPKSGTCVGDSFKIIIKVNPAPKIPDSLKSICTNTTFNTTPVHTGTRFIIPSGTTYTWATPTLSGAIVGSSAQTNQTTISQTLINNTSTNQTAAYSITANSNTLPNCSSKFYDTITVEPKINPVITCGTSSSTTLEFTWADIAGATSYEYVYKVGLTGTLSSPPQSISAGISPRITSTTITGLSAGNNVYFTLTPVGILCPLPETKLCSNCVQPTIVNNVTATPTDFEICIGETIRLKASEAPTNTNQWSIVTNNIVSNTINSSKDLMDITGLKAGTTDIEFENDAGCKNSITVTVNPKPEIAKIIKSICYGGLFDTIPNNNILTTNVVPIGTTYTWAPVTTVSNVTGITTVTSPETSFKQNLTNGTNVSKVIDYKVKATSGAAPNTCSNNFDVSVTLNPTPKIAPINKVLCSTDAFDTIPNNTSLSTNIVPTGTTYTWDLPAILTGINGALAENTNTKTSFKQTLTNTTNNSIAVNYIVTAKSGTIPDQCTSTFNTTLTVNPTPKIDNITLAICSEETFDTIPDNSSPNSIPAGTKYTWNIGVPPTGISGITAGIDQSSIKQTLKNTTANPIDVIYTIRATSGVVPNQCSKTFTLTAKVNPTPKIITVDTIKICENIKTFNQFNLNETGGIASSWEWSSNLTTSLAIIDNKTTTNPSVKNGINGEAFKVIGTDINGCKNTDTTILKILPLPIFTPTVDTACVNGTLNFKANLNLPGQTNAWTGPNGYTNSNESFQLTNVSLNKAGKYYIKITGANTCSKLDSVIASVHPLPVFTPSYTKPCENTPLIIRSNYKKGVSYVWSGPNSYALTSTVDSTKITSLAIPATHSGDYYVEITDTNTCVKKEKVTVNIFPKPTVSATNSIQICANIKSFTLDETATDAISWIWTSNQFAKFKDKSLEKPTVTEAADGEIFKVIGKDANGCIDSATTKLSINPIPIITPKEVCVDKRVTLTATHTPATSNAWKSENVSIATIDPTSGEMLGVAGGKSNIIYIDDKGCTDTSIVTINALPKITTSPLEVCEESTLQLKADHAAVPLNGWKSSDPSNATISNTGLVQGIKTGKSSIEFKDSKGCTTKEELTVNLKPVADFKAIYESICVTDSLFLIDKSKPLSHTYIWSFGDGISSKHNAHKYLIEGTFDITLVSITNKGCTDTMTKNKYIEVIGLPKVTFSFTPDSIDIFEPEIRFMNHSNAKHYEWVFGDGLPISVQENPTHTFPTTTGQHYTVTLTGYNTENGCSTSYSQMIVAKEPLIYYIPNTFTPNGDEYNNAFKPIFYSGLDVYNYHLIIYNRWGEVIFESFNVDFGWDGTYGNQIAETATYIWKLEFKEKNKENTHSKTGHVNVLR